MTEQTEYFLRDLPSDSEFVRLSHQGSVLAEPIKMKLLGLGLEDGMRCLEIGPGTGELVRWLVGHGVDVTVLDIMDHWFETFAHERVDARAGDVRTADLGSGYDFVVASWVLHHLPARADVVERLVLAVRPGLAARQRAGPLPLLDRIRPDRLRAILERDPASLR